jgi:catechol 2,3-dioxygenase-like lactoylglutathione lyase family enzyme
VFDHVTIRASDREASERFYDTVLRTLGIETTWSDEGLAEWDDFSLSPATSEKPATRRLHVAFAAPSRAHVDEFWRVGTEAGYRDDGPPGPRPQYREDYYGSFLLDPDGNSAEAVHHGVMRRDGVVDHLWIRVADVAAATAFYDLVAPFGGFRRGEEQPNKGPALPHRTFYGGDSGSFSVVSGGEQTRHLHVAFPARDNATVDAFHAAAIAAGYRDNGPPGERPRYHAGYYAAFVLDPDGTNVEVVCHNR